ncbi:mycothiol system anti-sigma-R factor [Williamsia sp. CHRR-6]|uniref:mycothiol system anti-sigma-R factor n=1 Tax=Williamsia sp. CHRR-6 TaxID=2835871 RepID=UPI001BD925FC|nr:mycothiol system anti-sigma-R factor [Williamsia sp. CHRR-6]MBT0565668.1 mycothiol system anti-sigma-R factor [Williamsia sp. CHRR-6]
MTDQILPPRIEQTAEEAAEFEQLDCSAVIADVWLLLDDECEPHARERLQEHLDNCSSCLSHYGIEAKLKSLISRKCGGDTAPAGFKERLTLEIRQTVIEHVREA